MLGKMVEDFMEWIRSMFWSKEMELTMLGLQGAGKTTLVNVIAVGEFNEETIPTVGFNMRKVNKGNVTIKFWDLGGQPRFRGMWERYCRGVSAIVYVVDSADPEALEQSRHELHELLSKPSLANIPVLVLGNKNDVDGALKEMDLIEQMQLRELQGRELCCYSISAKNFNNIDITMEWLVKHAKKPSS